MGKHQKRLKRWLENYCCRLIWEGLQDYSQNMRSSLLQRESLLTTFKHFNPGSDSANVIFLFAKVVVKKTFFGFELQLVFSLLTTDDLENCKKKQK